MRKSSAVKSHLLPFVTLPDSVARTLRRSLQSLPGQVRLALLSIMSSRRLTHADFVKLCERFRGDVAARGKYLAKTFHCRTVIDPNLIRVIKKLKADFQLINFVETGTFDGDTSLFFSLIFDRVFTCDVVDHPRRPEFYFRDNLTYETKSSPNFLRDHLNEIKSRSLFYLDAHWNAYWPLRDELAIVFSECENPVVVLDDFDVGNGLEFDTYGGKRLDFDYIADLVPPNYHFVVNSWSNRNKGLLFLFPGWVDYGCPFGERSNYDENRHGLWDKI